MHTIIFVLLSLSTLLPATATSGANVNWPGNSYSLPSQKIDISVGKIKFLWGAFHSEHEPLRRPEPSLSVVYRKGVSVNWTISLDTEEKSVLVKEVFTLPAASKAWTTSGFTKVMDGRVAQTNVSLPVKRGMISNGWELNEGDPPGEYEFEIFYKNRLLYSVKFYVQIPEKS